MNSLFYPIYQAAGWLMLYVGVTFALYIRPWFTPFEFLHGAVLIGSAALYSHVMRAGYKRWIRQRAFVWQLLYFFLNAGAGGALAGLLLVACVWALASTGITDPIAKGQEAMVFKMVFWGNAINMVTALLLWSGGYLTVIKARQLRDANQALASSQLDVLIQQLSPHFLFNVLNNIRAMILDNPTRAREALAQLADMLRYNLQRDKNTKVTLEEELGVVEQYVALCKLHYENRLVFNAQIDPASRELLLPRMLLQLCVENAIKHGIGKLADGGEVTLTVRVEAQCLSIELSNPCPAHPGEQSGLSTGIGLHNIADRLALMYDKSQASVSFNRRCAQGDDQCTAHTSILLPCETET